MNYFHRAITHVKRNEKKTILLFSIIFCLGNFMVGSYSINQSCEKAINSIKSKLAANVTIHANFDFDSENEDEVIESILSMQDERVQYYDYGYTSSFEFENIFYRSQKNYDFSYLIINTINNIDYYDLKNNNIIIVEGRNFTKEELENGSNVIIIDEHYIKRNQDEKIQQLEVGDFIDLKRIIKMYPSTSVTTEFEEIYKENEAYEIIGIFRKNYQNLKQDNNFWYTRDGFTSITYSNITEAGGYIPTNTLINEVELMKDIKNEIEKNVIIPEGYKIKVEPSTSMKLDHIIIKLNDSDDLYDYCDELKKTFSSNNIYGLEIFSSNDAYELIMGPVESISNLSTLILCCSILVTIIILSLVIFLFVRDRKNEIGLYISLGESKKKIILQIFCELYLVGVIALTCSIFTGYKFGEIISKYTLNNEIATQEEVINEKLELLESVNVENLGLNTLTEEVNYMIDIKYIVSVYVIESLILILSIIFPVKYLFTINPKNILL